MNVKRYDIGAGLGAAKMRALVVIEDADDLEKMRMGTWHSAVGLETGAGQSTASSVSTPESVEVFFVGESGAGVVATARFVNFSINHDLTDTGLSEVSISNTDFSSGDPEQEHAPREWDRHLPFLAQKVIDAGYNLPLPYGVAINLGYNWDITRHWSWSA